MKRAIRVILFFVLPALFIAEIVSCNLHKASEVMLDVAARPFEKLSEYHFFEGTMNELKPNKRVLPYDLITPLFTDYAHKARFVYMPEGKSAEYDTTRVLQLPVGACLIKTFYYPDDFRQANGKRRILETRVLVRRESGWDNLDYIWNDNQTEATLENAGDIKKVSWTHYDGTKRETDYVIPNKNQCKSCHWRNDASFSPIGPKVRNLNCDYTYADGKENQLVHWTKMGFLKGAPVAVNAPKLPDWTDSVHYSLEERTRAYLEMNCGHCHSLNGPAYTSGLHLNWENNNAEHLGFCKAPVAAGKATGNHLYDIVPGHPEQSIMVYRVASVEPAIKMPEIGRTVVHQEGLDLITKWIAGMSPSDCTPQRQ
jgi:uncharacterized repeat protein (TIGR03806 family)